MSTLDPRVACNFVQQLAATMRAEGIPHLHLKADGWEVSLAMPPKPEVTQKAEHDAAQWEADAEFAHVGFAPPDLRAHRQAINAMMPETEAPPTS